MMIKKWLLFFLVITLMVAALAGCSNPFVKPEESESSSLSEPEPEPLPEPDSATPDGAVSELFLSAKTWDADTINGYLPGGVDVRKYVPAELESSLSQVLGRMEYSIGDSKITGDTAVVEVTVTAVNADSAMNDAVAAAAAYAIKSQLSGKEVGYMEVAKAAVEAIDIDKLPNKTTTATAHMVRDGDEWKLDTANKENMPLLNAASGGAVELYGKFKELADTYGIALAQ